MISGDTDQRSHAPRHGNNVCEGGFALHKSESILLNRFVVGACRRTDYVLVQLPEFLFKMGYDWPQSNGISAALFIPVNRISEDFRCMFNPSLGIAFISAYFLHARFYLILGYERAGLRIRCIHLAGDRSKFLPGNIAYLNDNFVCGRNSEAIRLHP